MKHTTRLFAFLAATLAVVLVAAPVGAGSCRAVITRRHVVQQQVVVQKQAIVAATAIVTPVVAQFVQIPLYSAIYSPGVYGAGGAYSQPGAPVQGQGDADLAEAVKRLAAEVKGLAEKVNGAGAPPAPGRMPPADPFNPAPAGGGAGGGGEALKDGAHVALLRNKCASCHEAQKAAASGGGFTLFAQGKLRELGGEDLGKVIQAVASGSMPKGGLMKPEERLAVVNGLVSGGK